MSAETAYLSRVLLNISIAIRLEWMLLWTWCHCRIPALHRGSGGQGNVAKRREKIFLCEVSRVPMRWEEVVWDGKLMGCTMWHATNAVALVYRVSRKRIKMAIVRLYFCHSTRAWLNWPTSCYKGSFSLVLWYLRYQLYLYSWIIITSPIMSSLVKFM